MLTVKNVSKTYGKATVLSDVSFELAPGSVLAVIGANGAGKSTLIKSIVGLIRHDGDITISGHSIARDPKKARRLIGYVPQQSTLPPDLTVQEAAVFAAQLKQVDEERARKAVESAGLEAYAGRRVGALSGGMNQRLALALALLADPPLLVLDEPAAGLDVSARLGLRKLIEEQRALGKSVLLSTHWIEDVPHVADNALILDAGKPVYFGPASRLATDRAAASRLYLRLNGKTPLAVQLVTAASGAETVNQSGDWLVVTCPADSKAKVVETLVAAGVPILDFRVEEAPVDEAVTRMRHAQEALQ
ncbi:MAG TPA: ABC transporter ATP-binding protein [Tepidiformaceae bacterium]|nr:ABC transporter ATP-binding protein [Tepidiformaceae bacterium]